MALLSRTIRRRLAVGRAMRGGLGALLVLLGSAAALALAAAAPGTALGDFVLLPALTYLLGAQQPDGGWACVEGGESDIYCTSYALLGLAPYRARFFLDPQINGGATFLKARRNPSGSFGPSGASELLNTAAASLALATLPSLSSEIALIRGFL